jgi:membrane-associated protein
VAATGVLDLRWLIGLLGAAAIIGDQVGYAIGYRMGPVLFTKPKSLLFNPKHLDRTREFYARHGAKTIVIARFVPVIRTFAPVVAGVGQMEYRRFVLYNVAGGLGWVISMTSAGYLLGRAIPNIGSYVHLVVAIVVVLSVLPIVFEVVRARARRSG